MALCSSVYIVNMYIILDRQCDYYSNIQRIYQIGNIVFKLTQYISVHPNDQIQILKQRKTLF